MAKYPMSKEERAAILNDIQQMMDRIDTIHIYVSADNRIAAIERERERLAKNIRILTPSIPDIDLNRYLCPECGNRVHVNQNCCKCGQLLNWGFYTAD